MCSIYIRPLIYSLVNNTNNKVTWINKGTMYIIKHRDLQKTNVLKKKEYKDKIVMHNILTLQVFCYLLSVGYFIQMSHIYITEAYFFEIILRQIQSFYGCAFCTLFYTHILCIELDHELWSHFQNDIPHKCTPLLC